MNKYVIKLIIIHVYEINDMMFLSIIINNLKNFYSKQTKKVKTNQSVKIDTIIREEYMHVIFPTYR